MHVYSSILLVFSIYLILITSTSAANNSTAIIDKKKMDPQPATDLVQLSAEYRRLSQIKSHWDQEDEGEGGSSSTEQDARDSELVDNYDGPKHKVMKRMGELLGKRGTKFDTLHKFMDEPNEITRSLDSAFQSPEFMPGPVVPAGTDSPHAGVEDLVYLIYYWRGRHDFLWFSMDGNTETILDSGWYNALD